MKKILVFLLLVVFVALSQVKLLEPHLKYGFSDVDWGFLTIYRTEEPYNLSHFVEFLKRGGTLGGIYTHQIYYIGIQNDLFGLDFQSFQVNTHIFKTLATIAIFPLCILVSGSRLVAFIATVLFAFSYSTVGTMYTVVTSSDYLAIFSLGIFISLYAYIVKKNSKKILLLFLFLLLILTLFLSTERMYQLPLFILLTEFFIYWQKKKFNKAVAARLITLFLPICIIFILRPMVFLSYFLSHAQEIFIGLFQGNWNLLLTPFVALGSIAIPHSYTRYLGVANLDNFGSFMEFILTGPIFSLVVASLIIGLLVFKRSFIIAIQILGLMGIFLAILFILGSSFTTHKLDNPAIIQAMGGFYIIAVAIVSFIFWIKTKDRMLIGLFVGPTFAFMYIVLTWLGAATSEVFSGIHRYLTIPALFVELFLATLFSIIFFNITSTLKRYKITAVIVFIPLIFLIYVNYKQIEFFFNDQLSNGFGAADKSMMRGQLNGYLNNLSNTEASLFYFDVSNDQVNGYYYDNTLLGGFSTWMLWHPRINFNKGLSPAVFWDNPNLLASSLVKDNGDVFFLFKDNVYHMDNFYAFKLKDKRVLDIKTDLLMELARK